MDLLPPPSSAARALPRRSLGAVLAGVLLALAVLPQPWAGAVEPPGPTAGEQREQREQLEQRARLEDDLEAATDEERRLAGELTAAAAERQRLQLRLADVAARAGEALEALEVAEVQLGQANEDLASAVRRLEATERALAAGIEELQDQAVDSFIVGGNDEPIGVLMEAQDMREVGAASTYRDVVLEHQDTIVERVERLKVERVRDERAARRAKAAAEAAVAGAGQRRADVEAEQAELESLEVANAAAVLNHTTLLADVQARKSRYESELAALVRLSSSLAAAIAARQYGQVVSPAAGGLFVLPIPTARLSSSFGPRIHPIFGTARLHAGMDLAAPTGTPIGAAALGTVVTAGVLGGYGNAVVLDHGGGLSTLYAHQSAIAVSVGQVVEPGQVVGLVGSTGYSTGPHLHFEVRVLGRPVDPLNYL